jgi:hypothetical protein
MEVHNSTTEAPGAAIDYIARTTLRCVVHLIAIMLNYAMPAFFKVSDWATDNVVQILLGEQTLPGQFFLFSISLTCLVILTICSPVLQPLIGSLRTALTGAHVIVLWNVNIVCIRALGFGVVISLFINPFIVKEEIDSYFYFLENLQACMPNNSDWFGREQEPRPQPRLLVVVKYILGNWYQPFAAVFYPLFQLAKLLATVSRFGRQNRQTATSPIQSRFRRDFQAHKQPGRGSGRGVLDTWDDSDEDWEPLRQESLRDQRRELRHT